MTEYEALRRAEIAARSQRLIRSAEAALEQAAHREIPTQFWEPAMDQPRPAPEPRQQVQQAVQRKRSEQIGVEDAINASGIYIRRACAQLRDEMVKLAEEVAATEAATENKLAGRIADLEARLERSDAAVVDLLLQIERRLGELEQRAVLRPIKPQLVSGGGGDAG